VAQREAIQQALKATVGADPVVKFDVSPGLVCGIELSVNGQKLAWSVDDYLSSLNSHINNLLAPAISATPKGDANPAGKTAPAAPLRPAPQRAEPAAGQSA